MTNKDVVKSMSKQTGFTIVELLVVIVVIGILAAITIVSYTGITNRATIATIQSDLTNASTLLKMDQITTESFPTTLALANSGKGITPSQTMDSVIYIPDNTSNPKNFCLQYKKGTNTYAVDSTSSVSSGVCLQNLVTNGDFRNGTSGWSASNATISAANNIFTVTPTAQYGGVNQININTFSGHQYYISAILKGGTTSGYLQFKDGIGRLWLTGASTFNKKSLIYPIVTGGYVNVGISDNSASGWAPILAQQIIAIDLTAAFGAGNEPTQAQMDTIMSSYPNSWFNITAKASL